MVWSCSKEGHAVYRQNNAKEGATKQEEKTKEEVYRCGEGRLHSFI